MTTEQLKELYATGEWILISKMQQCQWHKAVDFTLQENYYKLIHKKHSEVLDHVLNGGEVKLYLFYSDITYTLNDFIETYDKDNTYEIIKDKPSLNEETSAIGGRVKESYDVCITDEPKPVIKRITREEILQHTNGRLSKEMSKTEIVNKLFDYIEYLELLLDAKDIPRKMSEGVDHRIRTLAKRVFDSLEANQKENR